MIGDIQGRKAIYWETRIHALGDKHTRSTYVCHINTISVAGQSCDHNSALHVLTADVLQLVYDCDLCDFLLSLRCGHVIHEHSITIILSHRIIFDCRILFGHVTICLFSVGIFCL